MLRASFFTRRQDRKIIQKQTFLRYFLLKIQSFVENFTWYLSKGSTPQHSISGYSPDIVCLTYVSPLGDLPSSRTYLSKHISSRLCSRSEANASDLLQSLEDKYFVYVLLYVCLSFFPPSHFVLLFVVLSICLTPLLCSRLITIKIASILK